MKKWGKTLVSMALGLFVMSFSAQAFAENYTIQSGDTLWKIAKDRQTTLQSIQDLNPTLNPLKLKVGQAIRLPELASRASHALPSRSSNSLASRSADTGVPAAFKKELSVVASAYTASGKENGRWAGLDYMGNKLKLGTISVDPSVIPLGSTVYITGYSSPHLPAKGMIAKATDRGGSVKGNRIDIFLPTKDAKDFGLQDIKVYLLD